MKCYGSKCKNMFAPSCYFTEHFTSLKKKECKWIMISKSGDDWVKRHRCKSWVETCSPKKGCHKGSITFKWGVKISYKTIKTCKSKFFGTNHKRKYCCTKRRICQNGKQCTTKPLKCAYEGNAWLVKERVVLYRWKTICKDEVVGEEGNDIRLKCCRNYQKCTKKKGFYKCKLEQRGACWWSGAARGDVHIFNGETWDDLNLQGTVKYLIDDAAKVYVQMKQFGKGTAITALAVEKGTDVVTLLPGTDGKLNVLLNGQPTGSCNLGEDTVVVKDKTVTFTINDEELYVELSQNIFELRVKLGVSNLATGIFVTGMEKPKDNCVLDNAEGDDLIKKLGFEEKIPCLMVSDPKAKIKGINPVACCKNVKGKEARSECESDCGKTGKCFARHYEKGEKFLKLR